MAAKQILVFPYGELSIFEKSIAYKGSTLFLRASLEDHPELLNNLCYMLQEAYTTGREDIQNEIKTVLKL